MPDAEPPIPDPAPRPRRQRVRSTRSTSPRKRSTSVPEPTTPPHEDTPPVQPADAADHGAEAGPEGESEKGGHDGKKGREPVPLGKRLLRALALWALLLIVTAPMGLFFERHTEEGKRRLDDANRVVAEVLRHAQPSAVAVRFYTRLLQDRGVALYQWKAPMNAAVARADLAAKYPRLRLVCGVASYFGDHAVFTGPDGVPCRLTAPEDPPTTPPAEGLLSLKSLTLFSDNFDDPTHARTGLKKESDFERAQEEDQQEAKDPRVAAVQARTAADAVDKAAYIAALGRIDRLVLLPLQPPPGSDALETGRHDAMTTLYTVVLGLPDAYLDFVHGLLPHSAAGASVIFVGLTFLVALFFGQSNSWKSLAFLLLLPVAVSLAAGLLSLASWGVHKLTLGLLSWSSLSVTVSAALTPFLNSATPEVVKHQVFEAVKAFLGKRFAVFAEE